MTDGVYPFCWESMMRGLRSLLHEVYTEAEQPPAMPSKRAHHSLAVTKALEFHGFVCFQYVVTPVPRELSASTAFVEGEAGIAVDNHAQIYKECSVAYRRSGDGLKLLGAVKIAPALRSGTTKLRVLFSPFALTPDLDQALCEVELTINGDRVEPVSIRWA